MKLLLLAFITLHCGSVHFVRNDAPLLTQEELNLLKNRKIGLIGFTPFKFADYRKIHTSKPETVNDPDYQKMLLWLNRNRKNAEYNENMFLRFTGGKYATIFRASPDTQNSTAQAADYGTPVSKLESKGKGRPQNINGLAGMCSDWHSLMNHYSFQDLKQILHFPENEISPELKNFDIDFWAAGYHGPAFSDRQSVWMLTVIPYILTLGTFPLILEKEKNSIFRVYDRQMNLVREMNYKEVYKKMNAWWIFWSKNGEVFPEYSTVPAEIFEADVRRFSKEFAELLKYR